MNPLVSPNYQMRLALEVKEELFRKFQSYDNVRYYLEKWHESNDWNDYENFTIHTNDTGKIDTLRTLHSIDGEILLKIAVDLGVATPDFIPSIASFRNEIKGSYTTAYQTFEKALKEIADHPDIAISLVNSALESILKEICKDSRLGVKFEEKHTLYDLCQTTLKALGIFPKPGVPTEIRDIGSSLLKVSQQIEKLRSSKTKAHGKADGDYIIDDPILANFVVNTACTVGIFLINFYKAKFPNSPTSPNQDIVDDLPF